MCASVQVCVYVCVYIPLLYVNENQEEVKEVVLALKCALGRNMLSQRAAGSKLVPVSSPKIAQAAGEGQRQQQSWWEPRDLV